MAKHNAERPTVRKGDGLIADTVTAHPAFGMVTVNRTHSTGDTLFASDLRHHEVISKMPVNPRPIGRGYKGAN
ncbi:TPA: hypothetical protein JG832_002453 [Enterobacter hormaechei subsp. xiangfangensis]|nr:hypothetical protein [Enterobacter hormaechei subsp. xiangfangensis]HAV1890589.1 hypothetical protein [Enterobacter hormaechei subsp. xiangfangensis]